ncbi:uncharacterized protein LOC114589502 [Podarcis muralis]
MKLIITKKKVRDDPFDGPSTSDGRPYRAHPKNKKRVSPEQLAAESDASQSSGDDVQELLRQNRSLQRRLARVEERLDRSKSPCRRSREGRRRHRSPVSSSPDNSSSPDLRRTRRRKKRSYRSRKHGCKCKRDTLDSSDLSGLPTMKIWVVGHSIVHWAADYAWSHNGGRNLNIHPKVCIYWMAQQGMRWPSLMPMLRSAAAVHGPSKALDFTLGRERSSGTKRHCPDPCCKGRYRKLACLVSNKAIGWSNLLPRLHWRGASNPSHINYAVGKINRAMRNTMWLIGGFSIPHPTIRADKAGLFRADGVHLTPLGSDLWLHDLRQVLKDWVDNGLMAEHG